MHLPYHPFLASSAYIAMTTSGLTASIALKEVGHIKKGLTVLVRSTFDRPVLLCCILNSMF